MLTQSRFSLTIRVNIAVGCPSIESAPCTPDLPSAGDSYLDTNRAKDLHHKGCCGDDTEDGEAKGFAFRSTFSKALKPRNWV